MNSILTKGITVVLLLCFSVSTLFYYLYFGWAETRVKSDAQVVMASEQGKETIAIPVSKWNEKETDEVWHDGHLYDVAAYHIIGDTVYISVWHDKDEETLLATATEHLQQDYGVDASHTDKQLLKKHKDIADNYKCLNDIKDISFSRFNIGISYLHTSHSIVTNCYLHVESPPPKA